MKHIDVLYHFMSDMVEDKKVFLKVDTLKNVANSLPKSLSIEKFSWCREAINIASLDQQTYKFCASYFTTKITSGECWDVCILCM